MVAEGVLSLAAFVHDKRPEMADSGANWDNNEGTPDQKRYTTLAVEISPPSSQREA